jgi:hypothetical protein
MTELETSARPEGKRMANHNTPQLSGMDSANHCAAFPGLSVLSTTTIRLKSAIELYRPSDRRLSEKLVPTFAYRVCYVVSVTDPYGSHLAVQTNSRWTCKENVFSKFVLVF